MWQVVEKRNIFSSWLLWHYVVASGDVIKRWKDLLRFNLDYFSIPFLVRTMFSPWRRYKISAGKGFDIGKIAEVVVFNTFSRFIGATMRLTVIVVGIVMQVAILFFGIIALLLWLLLPLLIISGLFLSLQWIIFN